jgi:hypothetical protein
MDVILYRLSSDKSQKIVQIGSIQYSKSEFLEKYPECNNNGTISLTNFIKFTITDLESFDCELIMPRYRKS